jgi:long-chain fatty acid transport protein
MTRLERTTGAIQGILAKSLTDFEIDRGETSADGGNPDDDDAPVGIPSVYYVRPFLEDWRFGFSLTVPAGFGSDYGRDWAGRYYTDRYSLVYVAATPSIAYRINEHWSVGAGVQITYTASESVIRIPQGITPVQATDGKLEYEADAVGVTGSVSLLYQFNDRTRIGLVYTGETSTDLEGDLEFSRLGQGSPLRLLDGQELEVENILPQRVQLGLYHEFESGDYVTLDGFWMDFSEFGTGDISLEGNTVLKPEGIYNDLWAITLGLGFLVDERMTWKVGAMHLSQAVDDDKRTLSIRLDRIFGVGVGFTRRLERNRSLDVNLNLLHMGDAPVDIGVDGSRRGRVVGESDKPWAVSLEATWHW